MYTTYHALRPGYESQMQERLLLQTCHELNTVLATYLPSGRFPVGLGIQEDCVTVDLQVEKSQVIVRGLGVHTKKDCDCRASNCHKVSLSENDNRLLAVTDPVPTCHTGNFILLIDEPMYVTVNVNICE